MTARGVPFVVAIRSDDRLPGPDSRPHLGRALAAAVSAGAWETRSAGVLLTRPSHRRQGVSPLPT